MTVVGAVVLAAVLAVWLVVVLPSSHAAARPPAGATPAGCASESSTLFGLTAHATLISQTDVPVCVTGQVTVTFAGDRATGCAAHGLCNYSGTETWEPQGVGDLGIVTIAQAGRRSTEATLVIGAIGTPVRSSVTRAGAATTAGSCRDEDDAQGGFFALAVQGGQVDLGVDDTQEPIFGTRCAGPLTTDLTGALPHRTMSLARLLRGHLTVELSGSERFAAGGFSGTVSSTIALALGRPHTEPRHVPAPSGIAPTRLTTVTYRVSDLGGDATATVRASGAAGACDPLDACGLGGTISVTPRAGSGGSAFLSAFAPTRRSERDLLTALGLEAGGDASHISVQGAGEAATGGAVTADLTQDGAPCTDHVVLQHTEVILRTHAGRLMISLSPVAWQGGEPLRTRCPGPALGGHPLTSASLPIDILRRAHFTVDLPGDSFRDGPYSVTTHSTLRLSLRRLRVRTQILPF